MAKTNEELEADILTVTGHVGRIMDQLKKRGIGEEMIMVFRCGASGLFYPSDYVKEWGRKYGIGLGPDVCSESLQSDYETAPPAITPAIRTIDQIMHPVYSSKAQMDWDLVAKSEVQTSWAILDQDDPRMNKRAPILREKQLANPKGRLKILQLAFERE